MTDSERDKLGAWVKAGAKPVSCAFGWQQLFSESLIEFGLNGGID
jgi:hypothetical protein